MNRRHDLDWLRIGAFLLLILYHLGMFYVPWGWHVKSAHAPVGALELPMKLMNPWRLPLLFFISGVALRYALDKAAHGPFFGRRLWILFVPLLFGMLVICAPQAWHELVQKGVFSGSVGTFYVGYIAWPWASPDGWPIITPTWNHLWYLLYVLVYSLILIGISWASGRVIERRLSVPAAARGTAIAAPLLHVALMGLLWGSVGASQTLWGDWYNLITSGLIMTYGFAVAKQDAFWDMLRTRRVILLGLTLGLGALVAAIHIGDGPRAAERIVRVVFGWGMIFTLLAWGQVLFARTTPLLAYLSGAVFTYYILHQTLIIMIGVPLSGLGWPLGLEALVLTALTALGCWAGYEFVARRIGRWGILLGARNPR